MNNSKVTIKYKTADGNQICVEVSTSVKELLAQSDRQIRSQRRQDRRYIDSRPLTDDHFEQSPLAIHEDAADLLERKERNFQLYEAIAKLTKIQQRRIILYFFGGLTYAEIARMDGVSSRAVIYSIAQALKMLRKQYQK